MGGGGFKSCDHLRAHLTLSLSGGGGLLQPPFSERRGSSKNKLIFFLILINDYVPEILAT